MEELEEWKALPVWKCEHDGEYSGVGHAGRGHKAQHILYA